MVVVVVFGVYIKQCLMASFFTGEKTGFCEFTSSECLL